jgi:hypothetical protein
MKSGRFLRNHARWNTADQKGIALITMLLLLLLLTALSLSMVMAFSSDMFMNGYNRTFRASFYAADAGNTIIRQDISNQLNNMLPSALPIGTYPLPASAVTTILSAINTAYGSAIPINSTASFPESFNLYTNNTSLTLQSCVVGYYTDATLATQATDLGTPAASLTTSTTCPVHTYAYNYTYTYHYSLTTVGTAQGTGSPSKTTITDSGNVIITATSENTINSFAQYGTFIDKQTICSAELIGGTITGSQFTNGAWTFGSDQSYNFTGKVGSASATAGYIFGDGTCNQVAGPSSSHGSATVSPTFQRGYQWGQAAIALPTNDYNQKSAVLTGIGITNTGTPAANPTTAQLTADLKDASGTYSYSGSTSSGVFIPVSSTTGIVNGGGIYVEGSASVSVAYSGTTAEVYTITQGSTTTTVTITPSGSVGGGTTVIKKGSNPAVTYNGVPTQTDPVTGIVTNAAVLYVDGNITALSGTIQDNTAVNITAANDMYITNNLTYKTAVVDSSGNETAAAAAGTATQTLGLYTSGGSIYLQAPTDNANMEIDASIMTTKDNGGTCNFGSSCDGVLGVSGNNGINVLTIVGGRIQSRAMIMPSGTINKRNVFFDQRYNGTFAPPFFPRPTMIINPPQYNNTLQRTGWVLQTAY